MTRLSSRQYAMWKKMPESFGIELARKYNQTTFGSYARRGWVARHGSTFRKTRDGHEQADTFGQEEIFRQYVSEKISVHFREQLARRSA